MVATATQPLTRQQVIEYVYAHAPSYGLDPAAVLAVGSQEGLNFSSDLSGIGDGGLAYGPWQDHVTQFAGRPWYGAGANNQAVQSWAWSPAGIDYVLGRMSAVASGKTGKDAVDAIVSKYELPADPAGEISRAWANFTTWVSGHVPSAGGTTDTTVPIGTPSPMVILPGQAAAATTGALQGAVGGLGAIKDAGGKLLSTVTRPGFWWAVLLFAAALVAIAAGVIIYFKGDLSVGGLKA